MKRITLLFLCSFLTLVVNAQTYFPPTSGTQWDTLDPASLGWCQDSIEALYAFMEAEESDALIVLKEGKIVLEKYFGTYTMDSIHVWNSASKSLRGALVGIAQEEGILDITAKTSDYLGTGWTSLPPNQEDSITIWHQLTMTSGLDESNFICVIPSCLNYVADAGTRWAYHNGPYSLLKDIIENQSGQTLNAYTNDKIESVTGMSGFWISFLGTTTYWSKARDMARFGLLASNDYSWNGISVLGDMNYIQQMRMPSQSLNPSYGYLWWLNGQASYITTGTPVNIPESIAPDAPIDVYGAAGLGGQYISISPSNDLVVIRQGESSSGNLTEFSLHNELWKRIMSLDCSLNTNQISNSEKLTVYPNPANETVHLQGISDQSVSTLLDFSGRVVLSAENVASLEVAHLVSGNYLIRVVTPSSVQTQQLRID